MVESNVFGIYKYVEIVRDFLRNPILDPPLPVLLQSRLKPFGPKTHSASRVLPIMYDIRTMTSEKAVIDE